MLLILVADASLLALRALLEQQPNRLDHSGLIVTINPCEPLASKTKNIIKNAKAKIIFIAKSMDNEIKALKRAMRVFLKSILEDCYFNICSFSSSHSLLWLESRRYTQENLDIAKMHVRNSFKVDIKGLRSYLL